MFIVQPISSFGELICEELIPEEARERNWNAFEFAVAWLNYSGAERFKESAREFLAGGGYMHATVGLDFGSTTYEGLGSLLDLEDGGAHITTNVFHDENPACTFHPKVFLFSNAERARLFVGSNNMTGAGLDTNVEAALGFLGALDDETIRGACQALAMWRDEGNDSRTKRLTRELLDQLRDRRYVVTEEELRNRRNVEAGSSRPTGEPLFGRSSIRPRRPGHRMGQGGSVGRTTGSAHGEVLLMRVRPRRNGNQLQMSMRVLEASFMNGAEEVVSTYGAHRPIGYNMARGVRNTARFEAPEMMGMQNPVARFQWVSARRSGRLTERVLQYEIFDANSDAEGATIFRKLEEGIGASPVTDVFELNQEETVLSTSDRARAQWYRLDSA
ncbi:MAG: phospholipase D family protein [Polaromonas sp.]